MEQRKRSVLVTGAYGLIGNLVYAHLADHPESYAAYGTSRRTQPSARAEGMRQVREIPPDRLRLADLTDLAAMQRAVAGMDVVVHMAAEPSGSAPWQNILNSNIIGSYNLFEACRLAGVQRVVYTSTNMVVFGYLGSEPYKSAAPKIFVGQDVPPEEFPPVLHSQPTWSTTYYASSKIFGESLARLYATQHGMSCICLRSGWVTGDDQLQGPRARILWCSHRDIVQLVERCITAPDSLRFDIFFGQSDNRYNLVDIQHARDVLGYAPQDSAEARLRSQSH